MHFDWVKGHAGIDGNELADRLVKEAAVEDGPVVYDNMPREVIITREDNGLHMWQRQWTHKGKGAVGSDQSFFPVSEEQVNTQNSHIPRIYNTANRTWEIKIIPLQIWTNR